MEIENNLKVFIVFVVVVFDFVMRGMFVICIEKYLLLIKG